MTENNQYFLDQLKNQIQYKKSLVAKTISVYIYGSAVTEEMNAKSDIDCILIAQDIDFEYVREVAVIKMEISKKIWREVFINLMPVEDLGRAVIENDMFVHRERPYLFLFDLKNNFQLAYGENIAEQIQYPNFFRNKLRLECVKLIRNLRYINYKLLCNKDFDLYLPESILKNILFAAKIFEIFFKNHYDSYKNSARYAAEDINDDTVISAYKLLKENEGGNALRLKTQKRSIDFYDKLLSAMEKNIAPQKTVKGCFSHNNFVVYFEIKNSVLQKNKNIQAILFLNGMPRSSQIEEVSKFFTDSGFLFLNVYYPGYWEGTGQMDFSKLPSGVSTLGKLLKKGSIYDLFGNKSLKLNVEKIFLVGSSFGATIALDVETDVFDKIIAVSPLVNFKEHQVVVDDLFSKLVFFSSVIRLKLTNAEAKKDFYTIDPVIRSTLFSPNDVLIITDKHDSQIQFNQVNEYSNKNQIELLATDYGMHGYRILCYDEIREKIIKFISN